MDTRLEAALQHANYMSAVAVKKEQHKLRFENAIIYAHNGGLFNADTTLISIVDLLVRRGMTESIVLDVAGNPVEINDLSAFLDDILSVRQIALNTYFNDFKNLRKARTVEAVSKL